VTRSQPTLRKMPAGLELQADWLTLDEEANLTARMSRLSFVDVVMRGQVARRKVLHFGIDYGYDSRAIRETTPLPGWLLPLRERAAVLADVSAEALVEVLLSYYPAGAGIGWHRDAPMFGRVVGVSLLGECTMQLRKRTAGGFDRYELPLPPRSAYLLSGGVRWTWQHRIPAVKAARYSITFRTLRADREKVSVSGGGHSRLDETDS
jgi:DNA oxidative demethylase